MALDQQLDSVVANSLEKGMQNLSEKILGAVKPYTRFVQVEKVKVADLTERLGNR